MAVIDLTAAWLPIFVDPGDAIAIAVTVPAGSESGTWTAFVYADAERGTPLATFTCTVFLQVITIRLTSAQVAGLLADGSRFTGHWDLLRTSSGEQRTWLKGDFVITARRA